jgi:outer membrane protein assembly factor BamE (lipoprotein component of BamABCDE complex)
MKYPRPSPRFCRRAAALAVILGAAACSPVDDVRGHVATPGTMEKLEVSTQSKEDVLRLLGSPSTVTAFSDKTWYYIRQRQEQFAFFGINTYEQSVVAISFNDAGRVSAIKNYSLKDGKEISMVPYTTPTSGKEMTIMDQILGNVGRFTTPQKQAPGQGPSARN